ncbi:type IV pilin protein [Candidatus Nitrospira salsa]
MNRQPKDITTKEKSESQVMLNLRKFALLHAQGGLSLLETIGVVSIGAVLAAMTLPHVYGLIADSKAESLVSSVKIYQQAISRYYADVGTLLPLDSQGLPHLEQTGNSANPNSLPAQLTLVAGDPRAGGSNLWTKFQGPYLEKFDTQHPPELGGAMYLQTHKALPLGAVVTRSNDAWDLKGDNARSDVPTQAHIVVLRVTGITPEQFLRIDKVVESDIGRTMEERQVRGRAKYDPVEMSLHLYLAHQ